MTDLPPARDLIKLLPEDAQILGQVVLSYEDRLLRRKRLETETGQSFMVDLPSVTSLDDYQAFRLMDGRLIAIAPADEHLIEVTGPDLLRFAWHIGNRHTPCQIEPRRLLIRADHVLEHMLLGLGAMLTPVSEPFVPEGGAYGHGRTMGHDHADSHSPNHHRSNPPEPLVLSTAPSQAHSQSPSPNAIQEQNQSHSHSGSSFGWHDHGDGKPHYHPPQRGAGTANLAPKPPSPAPALPQQPYGQRKAK